MTREELRDYVDEQRSLNNIPYDVYSTLIDGIDTLEQEPVLDKIIAEIEEKGFNSPLMNPVFTMTEIIEIIDKYKEG